MRFHTSAADYLDAPLRSAQLCCQFLSGVKCRQKSSSILCNDGEFGSLPPSLLFHFRDRVLSNRPLKYIFCFSSSLYCGSISLLFLERSIVFRHLYVLFNLPPREILTEVVVFSLSWNGKSLGASPVCRLVHRFFGQQLSTSRRPIVSIVVSPLLAYPLSL